MIAHNFMMVGRTLDLIDGVGAVAISLNWGVCPHILRRDQFPDRLQFCVWEKVSAPLAGPELLTTLSRAEQNQTTAAE
jgi:hypothetical protein